MACESRVSIIPTAQCLDVVRETDNVFEVQITTGEGDPINIAADSVRMTIAEEVGGTVVWQETNGPGEHFSDPNGKTQFSVPAAATATADAENDTFWVYEVRRIATGGDENVHLQGDFVVHPAVT